MPKPMRIALVLASLVVVALAGGCRAAGTPEPSPNSPSSTELVETPKTYDGASVRFTGEAIGEAMKRGDMAWLHLNDDAYYLKNVEEGAHLGGYNMGMPVWLPAGKTAAIEHFGDYKHEGDVVTVSGTFNAACAEHGGDMDIHATTLEVVLAGREVVDPIHPNKIVWAVVLSVLALALYLLDRNWERLTGTSDR
jgi:hypothetical protein